MAFRLTTATDENDLLAEVYDFATGTPAADTDGTWTGEYNDPVSERQIGLSKGNCHIAIGGLASEIGASKSPSGTDSIINLALSSSINTANKLYYGHPDSIVTTTTDADRVRWNDLGEAYNNVWLFSGTSPVSYIYCVVQTGERYTHMGFGIADPLGQTHPDVAFALATYYEWWPDGVESNNPADTDHDIGFYCEDFGAQVYIPNSSVLPASGFPAIGGSGTVFRSNQLLKNLTRVLALTDHYSIANGALLDMVAPLDNVATTGGFPFFGFPLFFMDSSSSPTALCELGQFPGVRHCNIFSQTPGDSRYYGSEEWLVFPLKRKGALEELQGGAEVSALANTAKYGIAYLKQ